MAKKTPKKVNKSELIRSYKEKHPDAGPRQISEALASEGVGYGLVASVLQKAKALKNNKAKGARPGSKGSSPDCVASARQFIKQSGGIDQAIAILRLAQEIAKGL